MEIEILVKDVNSILGKEKAKTKIEWKTSITNKTGFDILIIEMDAFLDP